jgi:carbamoyltransferase
MKIIWGICALNHDASISVTRGKEILFAGHAERYSKIKNDQLLNSGLISAAMEFGKPDIIVWYEKPVIKKSRQLYSGQWDEVFSQTPKQYLTGCGLGNTPIKYVSHHKSHAAAGYYTSGFNDAVVVVIDAIGEWDTMSVWSGVNNDLTKIHTSKYPNSLGLLYSALTQRIGLKPNEEEYILMGMAAYGRPVHCDSILDSFIEKASADKFVLKTNVHRGVLDWRPDLVSSTDFFDIAASIQRITEDYIISLIQWVSTQVSTKNLVLMGGCALNCVANEKIAKTALFDNIWIMPNPGDAGSSLGAILAYTNSHINWTTPYLGTNIDRPFNVDQVVSAIINEKIIGIASGKAEFGPRALGNRSLIADPRGVTIKDQVNRIKHRQQFRPFAPIVLAEHAATYFEMPVSASPYMQFTAKCKRPDLFPAICHIDGTSRVQTLSRDQNPQLHAVLSEFYKRTGCPILLNTSLNIKGQPLVDTWMDAQAFGKTYGISVF